LRCTPRIFLNNQAQTRSTEGLNKRTIWMEKAIADACAILYGGEEDTRLEDFLRDLLSKPGKPTLFDSRMGRVVRR
jgi:hypothetical protein